MSVSEIRTIQEIVVYKNKYVTVYDNMVEFPSGVAGTYFRTRWNAPFGVAVLPVCQDKVLLTKIYRYSEQAFSVEVPQGFGEQGEMPEQAAMRELFEETGLLAEKLIQFCSFGSDFVTYCYCAPLAKFESVTKSNAEKTESIDVFIEVSLREIKANVVSGHEILDPLTLSLLYQARELAI